MISWVMIVNLYIFYYFYGMMFYEVFLVVDFINFIKLDGMFF